MREPPISPLLLDPQPQPEVRCIHGVGGSHCLNERVARRPGQPAPRRAGLSRGAAVGYNGREEDPMAVAIPLRKSSRQTHPFGKYADDNHLAIAAKQFSSTRFMRVVNGRKKTRVLDPSGVTAFRRIQEFAFAIRDEWISEHDGKEHGWQSEAARRCGLNTTTMWNIIHDKVAAVDTETVDAIIKKTGIPAALFYDCEL